MKFQQTTAIVYIFNYGTNWETRKCTLRHINQFDSLASVESTNVLPSHKLNIQKTMKAIAFGSLWNGFWMSFRWKHLGLKLTNWNKTRSCRCWFGTFLVDFEIKCERDNRMGNEFTINIGLIEIWFVCRSILERFFFLLSQVASLIHRLVCEKWDGKRVVIYFE